MFWHKLCCLLSRSFKSLEVGVRVRGVSARLDSPCSMGLISMIETRIKHAGKQERTTHSIGGMGKGQWKTQRR